MKCEKQRHQGEENSSKPKRGTSVFSPHTPGCWGERRRGCTCGAARGQGPPALPKQGRPNQGPWLIWAWGAASDHALIHSFIHSFLPLTYQLPSKDQLTNCVECNCTCSTQ